MLEMIFLELSPIGRETVVVSNDAYKTVQRNLLLVMNKVVSHIVANISKYTTTENCSCRIPIVKEYSVRQLPKRYGKHYE